MVVYIKNRASRIKEEARKAKEIEDAKMAKLNNAGDLKLGDFLEIVDLHE